MLHVKDKSSVALSLCLDVARRHLKKGTMTDDWVGRVLRRGHKRTVSGSDGVALHGTRKFTGRMDNAAAAVKGEPSSPAIGASQIPLSGCFAVHRYNLRGGHAVRLAFPLVAPLSNAQKTNAETDCD